MFIAGDRVWLKHEAEKNGKLRSVVVKKILSDNIIDTFNRVWLEGECVTEDAANDLITVYTNKQNQILKQKLETGCNPPTL